MAGFYGNAGISSFSVMKFDLLRLDPISSTRLDVAFCNQLNALTALACLCSSSSFRFFSSRSAAARAACYSRTKLWFFAIAENTLHIRSGKGYCNVQRASSCMGSNVDSRRLSFLTPARTKETREKCKSSERAEGSPRPFPSPPRHGQRPSARPARAAAQPSKARN